MKRVARLRRDVRAVYCACRDPRTPWYAKAVAGAVAAYAMSPLDLIPDFIPVLGYLDDLVILPLGVALALRLVPRAVMEECRAKVDTAPDGPANYRAAAVVVALWLAAAVVAAVAIWRLG